LPPFFNTKKVERGAKRAKNKSRSGHPQVCTGFEPSFSEGLQLNLYTAEKRSMERRNKGGGEHHHGSHPAFIWL